jgi:hypothetical protein
MISEYQTRGTVAELREWLAQFPENMEVAICGTATSGLVLVGTGDVVAAHYSLYDEPAQDAA